MSNSDLSHKIEILKGLKSKFCHGQGGLYLNTSYEPIFLQTTMECLDILDEVLNPSNEYSIRIRANLEVINNLYSGNPNAKILDDIIAYLLAANTKILRQKSFKRKDNNKLLIKIFVDSNRIKELKTIANQSYDLAKLIHFCEELNIAVNNNCLFSIPLLVRAIMDHIPPIFGVNNFKEVANNYKGSKSFKDCMSHLENSLRKIADSYLHIQIRSKESLPTFTQVDFSRELDVLLSEIIRIIK